MRTLWLVLSMSFLLLPNLWGMRVVSLLPSNTEILDALGAGDQVVGITRFDHPRPGRVVVGDFFQPNLEMIVSLKPDLIVAGVHSSSRTGRHLKSLGYRVLEVGNPSSMEELFESIRQLSRPLHKEREAEQVIASMKGRLATVQSRARALPHRLKTYIEIDTPFWTIGGHDFLTEALTYAGVDNLFADLTRPSAQVSPEVIVERNPELILSFDLKKHEIVRRAGWSAIQAVQRGWVLDDVNRDALSRPSPALVDGIEALERQIEQLFHHEARP